MPKIIQPLTLTGVHEFIKSKFPSAGITLIDRVPGRKWVRFSFSTSQQCQDFCAQLNVTGLFVEDPLHPYREGNTMAFGAFQLADLLNYLDVEGSQISDVFHLLTDELSPSQQQCQAAVSSSQATARQPLNWEKLRETFADMSRGTYADGLARLDDVGIRYFARGGRDLPCDVLAWRGWLNVPLPESELRASRIDYLPIGLKSVVAVSSLSQRIAELPAAAPTIQLFRDKIEAILRNVDLSVLAPSGGSLSPMLAIAANAYHAGGGVYSSTGTQEEAVFRCTDIVKRIPLGFAENVRLSSTSRCFFGLYPVDLYSFEPYFVPGVNVLLPEGVTQRVFTAAFLVAPDLRPKNRDGFMQQIQAEAATRNIHPAYVYIDRIIRQYRTMYEYAKLHGNNCVINTFLGAGAFQNNKELSAMIAMLVANEYNMPTIFVTPDQEILNLAQQWLGKPWVDIHNAIIRFVVNSHNNYCFIGVEYHQAPAASQTSSLAQNPAAMGAAVPSCYPTSTGPQQTSFSKEDNGTKKKIEELTRKFTHLLADEKLNERIFADLFGREQGFGSRVRGFFGATAAISDGSAAIRQLLAEIFSDTQQDSATERGNLIKLLQEIYGKANESQRKLMLRVLPKSVIDELPSALARDTAAQLSRSASSSSTSDAPVAPSPSGASEAPSPSADADFFRSFRC